MVSQIAKQKFIIGHFDAHGVATVTARALSLNIPPDKIYTKYPDTSPENLPSLIDSWFPTLTNHSVEIVDIPVNLKDPMLFVNTIKRLANNTEVIIYDHHSTDLRYVEHLYPARVMFFSNALSMAEALAVERYRRMAHVGVVADRDSEILSVYSKEEVERELLPLANQLDILVRKDALTTARNLYSEGLEYIVRSQEPYPPEVLASQVQVIRRGYRTVLIDMTSQAQQIAQWSWKTMEQIAIRYNADYVIAVSSAFDRQINQYVPVVMVIRYWLSRVSPPRRVLQTILQGRQTIGHDDAFSVRVISLDEARSLAQQMFDELDARIPKSVTLINESRVAEAIREDFSKILERLTQLIELQTKMYNEYLKLKEEQVRLLREMSDRRARAD